MTATYRLVRRARPSVAPPRLDDAQRRVVEHAGGPLLVLAGPGTGKTTTLVEAAVARVDSGVPIEQLLMLTFGRRAAGELRDRITARLGGTVREPVARTFHSYAFGVLRMAAIANRAPVPRLLAGAEQDVIIRALLADGDASLWPPALRPALRTQAFAEELRDLLMRAVERGHDPISLRELGQAHDRPDWVAAAQFLHEYQGVTALRDPGGYDPAELIRSAVNVLLDDRRLLARERATWRHIFVDEYQDTDPAQAELLALLARGAHELILVGDPDQSIYAFRGADTAAIHEVDARFGGGAVVPVVALSTGRRSGELLVAATRRIAQRLPGPADQRRIVPAPELAPGRLRVGVFRSASEQAAYLAGVLRRAHLDGMPWSRMAVLVRSTAASLGPLRRAMITAGVPVTVRGEDIPLAEQPVVAMLLDVLSAVLREDALDEDLAERLLLGPIGGGDSVYLRRLRRVLRRASPDEGGRVAPVVGDAPGARVLPESVRVPVLRVAGVLAAGRFARDQSPEDLLWAIWDASGLARRWEAASAGGGVSGAAADRDLDAVVQLFAALARFVDRLPGANADQFTAHLAAQQIPGDTFSPTASEPEAVAVLTAHASKGLEWDLVCVADVQEGTWPDLRRRGSLLGTELLVDIAAGIGVVPGMSAAPQLAEERRLFYVAATRAREELVVTAVSGEDEQPSRFLDELDPIEGDRPMTQPQRGVHLPGLVAELRAVVCAQDVPAGERSAAAAELARLAAAGVAGADPDEWWGLAALSTEAATADPDRPVPVSPSRIDLFLTCELRTLMQDLGVSDDPATAASLGIVIHEVAARVADGQPLEAFERELDELWSTIDFGATWFAANERDRARGMLERLVAWLRESRTELTRVAIERDFRVQVGDASLSGRVDRLERDAQGRLVVVDLKTGKSKPKPDELPTLPQLGAYQLAIEHGAFPDEGDTPGGALLVQLGSPGARAQQQPPLSESDDPQWVRRAVDHVAERMRGYEFDAIENGRCQLCDVRTSCPLQPNGRQVTS